MRSRTLASLLAAVAAAGLTACGAPAKPAAPAAGAVPSVVAGDTAAPTGAPGGTSAPAATAVPGGTAAGTTSAAPTGAAQPGTTPRKPAAPAPPAKGVQPAENVVPPGVEGTPEEVPIDGSVEPFCVEHGGAATLRVTTKPRATVTFVAVYAGEKSGAARPFGEGHGGNAQGQADFRGQYMSTWVVAPGAPVGNARALVVVSTGGKQRAVNVPFVVRAIRGCTT